jgi:hypothetical protein
LRATVSKGGSTLGACCHPSRHSRDFVALVPQDDGGVYLLRRRGKNRLAAAFNWLYVVYAVTNLTTYS